LTQRHYITRNETKDLGTRTRSKPVYKILVGVPEGKRPLGRPRHRGEDNIRMDIREIEWEVVD
jgi:hypothetical protein